MHYLAFGSKSQELKTEIIIKVLGNGRWSMEQMIIFQHKLFYTLTCFCNYMSIDCFLCGDLPSCFYFEKFSSIEINQ